MICHHSPVFKRRRGALFAGVCAVLLAGSGLAAVPGARAQSANASVPEASGGGIAVTDTGRTVSLGGSITEILYALGLDDRIVAIDTTSLYPADALSQKPNVGYLRALSPEGVLSTDPGLILAEHDAGPPEAVALLEAASVPFMKVPDDATADGVAEKIRFVATTMGVADAGADMADAVAADLATVKTAASSISDRRKVLFVLSMAGGRIMAAGDGTSAAAMIELAGGDNAMTGFSGYKPVNDEAVIEAAPEVIVMMAGGDHAAGAGGVFAHPAMAMTPAAESQRLVSMDGLYLLGFGPRVAHAARDLFAAIYPEAAPPVLPERPWAGPGAGTSAGQ